MCTWWLFGFKVWIVCVVFVFFIQMFDNFRFVQFRFCFLFCLFFVCLFCLFFFCFVCFFAYECGTCNGEFIYEIKNRSWIIDNSSILTFFSLQKTGRLMAIGVPSIEFVATRAGRGKVDTLALTTIHCL